MVYGSKSAIVTARNGGEFLDRMRRHQATLRHNNSVLSFGALVLVAATVLQTADAYPALMMYSPTVGNSLSQPGAYSQHRQLSGAETKPLSLRKRAFDRLDVSPFDFEALSKRFNDDEDLFYGRRRRAFDRLDDNAFMGLMSQRKRRAFDRLEDSPFALGKRSAVPADYDMLGGIRRVAKRSFDRLDSSAFGIAKRAAGGRQISIDELLQRWDAEEENA